MIRLRPYKQSDSKEIVNWISDEKEFVMWCANNLNYPLTVQIKKRGYIDEKSIVNN